MDFLEAPLRFYRDQSFSSSSSSPSTQLLNDYIDRLETRSMLLLLLFTYAPEDDTFLLLLLHPLLIYAEERLHSRQTVFAPIIAKLPYNPFSHIFPARYINGEPSQQACVSFQSLFFLLHQRRKEVAKNKQNPLP